MAIFIANSERKVYSKPDSFPVKKMRGVVGVPYMDLPAGRQYVMAPIHQEDLTGKGKRELVITFGHQLRRLEAGQLAVVSGGIESENNPEDQVTQEFIEEWGLSISTESMQKVEAMLRILQWRNGETNAYINFLVSDFYLVALTELDFQLLRDQVNDVRLFTLSELLLLPEETLRPLTVAVIQTISANAQK